MPNHLLYNNNKFKKENGDKWMPVHIPLVSIKKINSKKIIGDKWMPNHLLYNNNKFKKDIWRQKIISYSIIVFQFILYRNQFTDTSLQWILKAVKWLNWNVVSWLCRYL